MEITAQHERWQEPDGQPEWAEGHRLELFAAESGDGPLAVVAELRRLPNARKAHARAAVLEAGKASIGLTETDIPAPTIGWEVRSSGIWAEFVCETPLDHWSYGLEAFALEVDGPRDLIDLGVGHRVPLGWELEFEAAGPATWIADGCYIQAGRGHGLLLSADGEREIETKARRWHWWGIGEPFVGESDGAGEGLAEIWLPDPTEQFVLSGTGLSVGRGPW